MFIYRLSATYFPEKSIFSHKAVIFEEIDHFDLLVPWRLGLFLVSIIVSIILVDRIFIILIAEKNEQDSE